MTLLSRVTGLVRDVLMASAFGAGAMSDAFNVAFRMPNLLRRLFAEGAFVQAFTPILTTTREQQGAARAQQLIDQVATVLTWVLLAVSALGVLLAPALVWMFASGLEDTAQTVYTLQPRPEGDISVLGHSAQSAAQHVITDAAHTPSARAAAITMTRWMFPYIAMISLVALAASVLNTWGRFARPAFAPVLLNVAMIAAAWWLAPQFALWGIEPIYAMAAGVMLGGVLQLAWQFAALRTLGLIPRIGWRWQAVQHALRDVLVQQILRNMAPVLLGAGVAQLSLLINTQIASHLSVGSVSWLFYADRLMEFPTALIGVALGAVLMAHLSRAKAAGDRQRYQHMLDWGLRLVVLLVAPCAVAFFTFAQPLVAVLFHRGALGAADVEQIARALSGYGAGLLGLVAVKVLASAYYAKLDTRTPALVAVGVLVFTQLLNVALVPQLGHAGLAWSIGLAALANAAFLAVGLWRRGDYCALPGWGLFLAQVLAACLVLAAALLYVSENWAWLAMGEFERMARMVAVMAGAAILYFGMMLMAGFKLRAFIKKDFKAAQ